MLVFDVLPPIKRINHVKLYRSGPGEAGAWPVLAPAMTGRAIRWDLIAEQYDQMIPSVEDPRRRSTNNDGPSGMSAWNRRASASKLMKLPCVIPPSSPLPSLGNVDPSEMSTLAHAVMGRGTD